MIKDATPDLPSPAPEGECKECGTPLAMGVHSDDCSHSGGAHATIQSIIDQVSNQAADRSDGCLCMASERMLVAEVERLQAALASSCVEEREQLYEAVHGGGCERALKAESEIERLTAALDRANQIIADRDRE